MEEPMITLYAGTSPNVQKIYLALEEMGLPYQAEPVDVFGGAQFHDAFRKVNPLAKVPAIRDHTLQWMMVQMTGIGPMFGQFVHFSRFAPKPAHEYSVNRYRTQTVRFLEAIEGRLTDSAYLGGSEYSIADMATYPWTRAVPALLGAES